MTTRHTPVLDPAFQRQGPLKVLETSAAAAPLVNFAGLSSAASPPDTTGDVGPGHYIQMVNATSFQIWSKTGTSLVGPTTFGTLWSPATANAGDPIVVYDGISDRWVLSQFHSTGMYFAISQTSDPTAGTWYLYDFTTYTTLPDYPKIGVWPDGYLMTTYEAGLGLHVFDRAKMVAGQPATFMKTTVPQYSGTVRDTRILPVHLTGPAPSAGTPGYFMRTVDHQQDNANPQDRIEIYKAIINFNTSTFNVSLSDTVIPAPFNTMVANRNGGGIRDVIPQPGTTATLDALSNRPMMQLGYRQFGSVAKMVFCQTIDISGSIPALTGITPAQEVAGIRWYILQQTTPGGAWSIEQQGTFGDQPAGITAENQLIHRWMGSAALNGHGDLAIGYSACNDDDANPIYPGIRYTGRVVTDPVNTLPQGEGIIMDGTSSKGANGAYGQRWGDYAQMGVDPTDDSTFWFTTHVASGATRIASFALEAPADAEIAVAQPATNGLFDGSSTRNFGILALGDSSTLTFTITNLGLSNLSGLAVSIDGVDAADFAATQPAVTTLATAASTTFTVTFNRGSYGTSGAVLHIASNDTDENPFDVNLTGAVALPDIALEQPLGTELTDGVSTTDFGLVRVGNNSPLTFRIRNAGGPTLSGLSVSVDGADASDFTVTQPAATSLMAGENTSFTVTFAPTATGVRGAVLHIASNDVDEASFDVNLTGEGFMPDIAVEEPEGSGLVDGTSTVSYGNVFAGANLTKRFAIRNAATGTLNLGAVSIDGVNSTDFVLGPLSLTRTTLAPGQTAYFDVSFRPSYVNSKSAVLHIASDDPDEAVFDINLAGFATTPGGPVQLARDININPAGIAPSQTTVIGSNAFFIGITTEFGSELWKTDGTTAGTTQLRDIFPGVGSSSLSGLTTLGGLLVFSASNGTNGQELWKSDGTFAGTTMVRDINSGTASSTPTSLTAIGSTLFFAATDTTNGTELWKSDGTSAGTVLVANIAATSVSSLPANLRAVGSTLFFTANNGINGTELWKSDGTAGGTMMVKDIVTGTTSSSPTNLTAVGTTLYFTVNDTVNGTELWKSDGTDAGTAMVKDINPGASSSFPTSLTAFGGLLYFSATTAAEGAELWVSDGTSAGTVLLKDINPGVASGTPQNFLARGSTLYFSGSDATAGRELWQTDGTTSGTVRVKDTNPGANSSNPTNLALIGSTLYFQATDGVNGVELWKSDGTDAGTMLVKDIAPGSSSSGPSALANLGGTLVFTASDALNGQELWKSDGTAAGTVMVLDGQAGSTNSSPANLRRVNGTLYFSASDGGNGTELWKSDGTAPGTVMVKNINPIASASSSPANFSHINSTLYFSASDGTNGTELWKSDGTSAGTVMVKNINITTGSSSSPTQLAAVGTTLFFSATDGTTVGTELWKSDGTDAGTVLVKDINPTASAGSSIANMRDFNGMLYFSANDGTNGTELWRSDGSPAGTVMVMNINAGSVSSSPANLTVLGSTLYFTATTATSGTELWKTDGTTTVQVADIASGTISSSPANLTVSGGTLYFSAGNSVNGIELWKIDNATGLPVLVRDIIAGASGSSPSSFADVGGTLFFRATTTAEGIELWKSDGTTAGTVLVSNINPGTASSTPFSFVDLNGTLFMSADQGAASGRELWKSDGTAAGTVLVADLMPGAASSNPANLTVVGSLLFYTGIGPNLGSSELFVLDTAPEEEIQIEQPLATILTDGGSTVDFGTVEQAASPVQKEFIIRNLGGQPLVITELVIDGPDSAGFSAPALLGQTIPGGGSFNLTVSMLTTSAGVKSAYLHIGSTDGDETPFDIQLTGTVVIAPDILLEQPAGTTRLDDRSTVVFGDSVFGVPVTRSFTLKNTGSSPLLVSAVTLNGEHAADFSTTGFTGSIAAATDVVFDVIFTPTAAGARVATLRVLSNDSDEASYDIQLVGLGSAPPGDLKLLKDINAYGAPAGISSLVVLGSHAYFAVFTNQYGNELWKTDGTTAGTTLVKDINPGNASSGPANLTVIGSSLYFSATTAANGFELWKTDGTDAGTVLVKDINPGTPSSSPANFVNFGGTLFFSATDTTANGVELWKSDGTTAGTVLVSNINTAAGTSSSPSLFTVVGSQLFFRANGNSGTQGIELWKTDGTAPGTVLVKDIYAGSTSSSPSNLTALGSSLIFTALAPTTGTELYISDGTDAGTVLLKDINAGTSSSSPALLTLSGSWVYFRATTSAEGEELWRTDGTPVGTALVKDINSGVFSSSIASITAFGSGVIFSANGGTTGWEPWRSDGTFAGTVIIKEIRSPGSSLPSPFSVFGSVAYFHALGTNSIFDLWRTDGTDAGTYRVLESPPGSPFSFSHVSATVSGRQVLLHSDGSTGAELWTTDGTEAGTLPIKDFAPGNSGSAPSLLTVVNDTLFFRAFEGSTGTELWKATPSGEVSLVKDIGTGNSGSGSIWSPSSSSPASLTAVGSTLFFAASSSGDTELWKSDGTPAGTVRVKNIASSTSSSPANLTAFDSQLFFTANDGTNGTELWKSDGSDAGTVMVKNISPGAAASSPANLVVFNGFLYFSATDGVNGAELWRTDGTDAGTIQVADINPGSASSTPANFRQIGSTLYFTATTAANGLELWKTDGTSGGTVLVSDIVAGVTSSSPASLTAVGTTLFFTANAAGAGVELWKTDGTSSGTVLVKDINVGISSSTPLSLTHVDGTLFFSANNGTTNGAELWKSDGTSAGTVMVKDINAGILSSSPSAFTNVYGILYFRATTTSAGAELWRSDGTEAGTVLVADVLPGPGSSLPTEMVVRDHFLYFNATGQDLGTELWAYDLGTPEISIEQPAGTVLVDGASTVSFGSAAVANGSILTLTLKNLGTRNLAGISAGISGTNLTEFSVSPLPFTLAAGGSTTFTVTFNPSVLGLRTAILSIASDDSDENPFDITLEGTGVPVVVAPVFLGSGGGSGSGTGGGVVDAPGVDGTGSVGRWESLRSGAVLSSNGHIAFRGFMEIGSGSPPVTMSDFQGIWRFDGTDTRLKARSGSTAPESGGALFDMLPLNPAISPNGLITFYGTLRMGTGAPPATSTDNLGLWSELGGGAVRLLLRKGDTIVSGKTFRSGWALSGSSANTVALNAKLSSGTAVIHLDVNTPSVLLTVVAEEGQNAPGGGTWVALDGNSSDPRLSANGDLGFIGWELEGGAYMQGIYSRLNTTAVGTSGATLQARMGATAPGTSLATFFAFERPTVFNGGMAFRGFLNLDGDNAGGTKGQGVWAGSFGSLAPVVRTGDTTAQIPTIPAGSSITSVWSPFSNALGSITMRVGLNDGVNETRAIMGSTGGTMRAIAKAGDAAPGLAGQTFANFDHPVIGDGDQVAFTASTDAGTYGIWKEGAGGGALSLVMKVGDIISTGTGNKVVAEIALPGATSDDRKFEERCMDATGRLLIHVTFSDGTTSLLLGQ